ncbi:hypertrehalosaemic prohormone [Bombus impatiens]|nr:hypertrehalosaemic prohormone [Bombus impatiens]
MHRKVRLEFLVFSIILLLCLILNSGAEAQLNFSTGWGKRSQRLEWSAVRPECPSQARPSLEQLLNVYHLIQMEARKMLECRKPNE